MLKYILVAFLFASFALFNTAEAKKQEHHLTAGPVCELCTLVLTAAQHELQNNRTEDQVITFIEKQLCGKLGPMNATCVQYIEANGRQILDQLAKKIDPSVVCKNIGLCSTQKPDSNAPYLPMVDNSLNCTLCKLVFTQVQNMLKNNQSEQQILQFIETKLCNATGALAPECKLLIDKFGPYLLRYVADGTDPEKLCELIGMCSATFQPHQEEKPLPHKPFVFNPVSSVTAVNPIYCTLCEYAVQFIDVELKKNATETNIVDILEKTCKVVPEALKKECSSIVDTYGIYLVQLLIELADPLKVCEAIQLCQ